ncbi:MAG TPA: fumarylacetoacetate hydrolase family protein [Thermoanaerobaculia bacterium]|jgi:2-keto-4-pentenoate hydratase/2-oxohepta-3-ene-1,7-dioic acid hydratase in catechol pathway|nr:fumarylacetoacetate hydrolase family protein [Thermoanaerobaculia bacterium]
MLLYRLAPDGHYAVQQPGSARLRALESDPFVTPPADWKLGPEIPFDPSRLLAPVKPGKIIGIGRNYKEHVKELNNPMPAEPVIFLKAPSSLIPPGGSVVLPPESQRVEHEGEIAVVVGRRIKRATPEEARAAILGITCADDVTARDLQRKDPCFSRAKSFDTFCPLGPAILVGADLEDLEVVTRVNGQERQRGHVRDMTWGIVDLVVYASRMMTLEPGDVLLTGTPSGVGPLQDGDQVEIEVSGVGVLRNPVRS